MDNEHSDAIGPVSIPFTFAAAVGTTQGDACTFGQADAVFPLASVTKPMAAWAVLVAISQGALTLDTPAGPEGSTVRHLLSHASGLPLDAEEPIQPPARRRIYSNAAFAIVGRAVEQAVEQPFSQWIHDSVFQPLRMRHSDVPGSPAFTGRSTANDLLLFAREVASPTLITRELAVEARQIQFPDLAGVVPGYGRFTPCPWGLGLEIKGEKNPHWTSPAHSPWTIGHFGQSGSLLWVDPAAGVSAVFVGRRVFGEWHRENWPLVNSYLLNVLR